MLRINRIGFVFIILTITSLSYSQNHLPKPDAAFLKRLNEQNDTPLHAYFKKYIGTVSGEKKQQRVKDSIENYVCAWEEKFKKGIFFKFNSCSKSDVDIAVDFINYSKSDIVKLVDTFYNDPKFSAWNKEKTKYQPISDEDAGCYIEIKKINKHKKRLSIYCSE